MVKSSQNDALLRFPVGLPGLMTCSSFDFGETYLTFHQLANEADL